MRKRRNRPIRALATMNTAAADFWREDDEQFQRLRKKYSDAHALRILEAARIIVDEHTRRTAKPSFDAAVISAEAIEAQGEKQKADARARHNNRRKAIADKNAIDAYRAWENGVAEVLKGMNTTERVRRYSVARKAHITRAQKDRITKLLHARRLDPAF